MHATAPTTSRLPVVITGIGMVASGDTMRYWFEPQPLPRPRAPLVWEGGANPFFPPEWTYPDESLTWADVPPAVSPSWFRMLLAEETLQDSTSPRDRRLGVLAVRVLGLPLELERLVETADDAGPLPETGFTCRSQHGGEGDGGLLFVHPGGTCSAPRWLTPRGWADAADWLLGGPGTAFITVRAALGTTTAPPPVHISVMGTFWQGKTSTIAMLDNMDRWRHDGEPAHATGTRMPCLDPTPGTTNPDDPVSPGHAAEAPRRARGHSPEQEVMDRSSPVTWTARPCPKHSDGRMPAARANNRARRADARPPRNHLLARGRGRSVIRSRPTSISSGRAGEPRALARGDCLLLDLRGAARAGKSPAAAPWSRAG
ncbi:hypothetical protein AB5J62_14845 [Amycolatopsis sp. cg5]|uniref:hypothetical protein n=1 Tax=Amycolatopsis sp. cg5 TaxID=3238802 RepID=UPI003523ECF1